MARSPAHVLSAAYDEALASLTPEMIAFYNQPLDAMLTDLRDKWDEISILDSPLQNLALLSDALDGTSVLSTYGVTTDAATLAAVFLGVASDKTVTVSTDTVIAVTTILGSPVTGTAAETLATSAEDVRAAVLEGHG